MGDAWRRSWPKTVARQIERADDPKVFDLREMQDLLDRSAGHRGRANVRAALDAYRPDRKFTRSGFERRFLEVAREAGLPEPAMNVFVAGHELDAYWGHDARHRSEARPSTGRGRRILAAASRPPLHRPG
jgi:hypothetical protein